MFFFLSPPPLSLLGVGILIRWVEGRSPGVNGENLLVEWCLEMSLIPVSNLKQLSQISFPHCKECKCQPPQKPNTLVLYKENSTL